MTIEENVNVERVQTEAVAEAKEGAECCPKENVSTVLGKFKDVDALARAYESLQAEFTRRSQKLRSLEQEMEDFKRADEPSGAEKLRKTARARREEAKEFDAFVAQVGERSVKEKAKREEPVEDEQAKGSLEKSAPEKSGEGIKGEGAKSPFTVSEGEEETSAKEKESLPSEELFKRAFDDEKVRLRIVGEYLASLGRSGVSLTGGGAGVLATPPVKAKTVGQAGDMALLYFRKPIL